MQNNRASNFFVLVLIFVAIVGNSVGFATKLSIVEFYDALLCSLKVRSLSR